MTERSRVIVLGGGFAGVAAAKHLSNRRVRVTLVDEREAFEFLPNIHELISGVKESEGLRIPLASNLRALGHSFVQGRATALDPEARSIELADGSSHRFEALIVATGGVDATRGVPGVVEHAFPFKSVQQCADIGERLRRLAQSGGPARVVIVGGGLEGIEALGEILRRYRTTPDFEVALVEARERVLPETSESIDAFLRELCGPYAVTFHTGSPVAAIEPDCVSLANGRRIASDVTIWTGGPAPPGQLTEWGLATRGGWAPVDESLQSALQPGIFVAGDAADTPKPIARQAYHAIDMGTCAAGNVGRLLGGRTLRRFRPSGKPTLVSFGDLTCIAVTDAFTIAGAPLAAAKEAVFQLVMEQLDARPLWRRLPRILGRSDRAGRQLLWPALSSLESFLRQADVRIL